MRCFGLFVWDRTASCRFESWPRGIGDELGARAGRPQTPGLWTVGGSCQRGFRPRESRLSVVLGAGREGAVGLEAFSCQATLKTEPLPTSKTEPPLRCCGASIPPPRSPPSPTGWATSPRPHRPRQPGHSRWPCRFAYPQPYRAPQAASGCPAPHPLARHWDHRRLAGSPGCCPQAGGLWGLALPSPTLSAPFAIVAGAFFMAFRFLLSKLLQSPVWLTLDHQISCCSRFILRKLNNTSSCSVSNL